MSSWWQIRILNLSIIYNLPVLRSIQRRASADPVKQPVHYPITHRMLDLVN